MHQLHHEHLTLQRQLSTEQFNFTANEIHKTKTISDVCLFR